ncbi:cupin domain-containing protein [Thalassococcus sp. S3]|uniref:cupin domain-containing protein n=1 Tax=Thalassococcus sp. S3 TaxID=2017482 RepID=UPI0013EE741B|nr:cupin domain-containing protein [Thalassococcus sp. S3]
MDAIVKRFQTGKLDMEGFEPFHYEEPDTGAQAFGEITTVRMEGSSGQVLAVGLWRVAEDTTSPVYSSQLGDETFVVLEGSVDIEDLDTGQTHSFGVGDIVSWSKGMRTRWTIHAPFKKFVVVAGT